MSIAIEKFYTKDNRVKEKIINDLSKKGLRLTILYTDDPTAEDEARGLTVKKLGPFEYGRGYYRYELCPPYSYRAFNEWLYCGAWQAVYPPDNTFAGVNIEKKEDVEKVMMDHGSEVLIDSYSDDIEWYIFRRVAATLSLSGCLTLRELRTQYWFWWLHRTRR